MGNLKNLAKFFGNGQAMSNRSSDMNLPHVQLCPAMIHGGVPKPAIGHGGVHSACSASQAPRHQCTPPPYMAGSCVFTPPCMEAGPNGLDLQILSKQSQIYIFFKFRLKIKKNSQAPGYHEHAHIDRSRYVGFLARVKWCGLTQQAHKAAHATCIPTLMSPNIRTTHHPCTTHFFWEDTPLTLKVQQSTCPTTKTWWLQ